MKEKITKLVDGDGHWYWIPASEVDNFNQDNTELNKCDFYMDYPDLFDAFIDKYEKYRTLGAPDNQPEYFKNKL